MGMFDTLRCQMPLPVVWPSCDFQTKDLGAQADRYTITPDGVLIKDGHPRYEDGEDGYGMGDMRMPIDGSFYFYDIHPARGWLILRARFVLGVCRGIEKVSWEAYAGSSIKPPPDRVSELPVVASLRADV